MPALRVRLQKRADIRQGLDAGGGTGGLDAVGGGGGAEAGGGGEWPALPQGDRGTGAPTSAGPRPGWGKPRARVGPPPAR